MERDFTTVAVNPETRRALDRFMSETDAGSINTTIAYLIWYHDLINHFEYDMENVENEAQKIAIRKETPTIPEL